MTRAVSDAVARAPGETATCLIDCLHSAAECVLCLFVHWTTNIHVYIAFTNFAQTSFLVEYFIITFVFWSPKLDRRELAHAMNCLNPRTSKRHSDAPHRVPFSSITSRTCRARTGFVPPLRGRGAKRATVRRKHGVVEHAVFAFSSHGTAVSDTQPRILSVVYRLRMEWRLNKFATVWCLIDCPPHL